MSAAKHKNWATHEIYMHYQQAQLQGVWQCLQSPLHLSVRTGKVLGFAALASQATVTATRMENTIQNAATQLIATTSTSAFELAAVQAEIIKSLLIMDDSKQLLQVQARLVACKKLTDELLTNLAKGVAASKSVQLLMLKTDEEEKNHAPEYMTLYNCGPEGMVLPSLQSGFPDTSTGSNAFQRRGVAPLFAGGIAGAKKLSSSALGKQSGAALDKDTVAAGWVNHLVDGKRAAESEDDNSVQRNAKVYCSTINGDWVGACTHISTNAIGDKGMYIQRRVLRYPNGSNTNLTACACRLPPAVSCMRMEERNPTRKATCRRNVC